MNLAWPKFPVDDLDAYERRQRRNHRLAATVVVVLAPMRMFEDTQVRVFVGITALVIGGIVGLAAGLVANHRHPDYLFGMNALPLWRRVFQPGILGVAAFVAVTFLVDDLVRTVLVSAAYMMLGTSLFLRAPAFGRYRRRRYEADLIEVAGGPRPSGV